MRIVATESVSLCAAMKSGLRFWNWNQRFGRDRSASIKLKFNILRSNSSGCLILLTLSRGA